MAPGISPEPYLCFSVFIFLSCLSVFLTRMFFSAQLYHFF